ncbi:MAG: IclR family transcriptional regulator [Acidimicrobiales bacterium]
MATTGTLRSVQNAVRVLKSFSTTEREWGVTELSRKLDLGKSTTHRLLATLVDEGMLEQNAETGRYRLGLAVFDLAAAVPTQFDLHDAVLPPMTALRSLLGGTVQVGVLDGREVVYIERLDSPDTSRVFQQVGRRNWAHCSATGKVLLASLPPTDLARTLSGWDPVERTARTITDIGLLRIELAEVRRRGYATNDGEAEPGVVSVAAPIRERSTRTIAALSFAGPMTRVDATDHRLIHEVRETAAQVSRRLGYRAEAV